MIFQKYLKFHLPFGQQNYLLSIARGTFTKYHFKAQKNKISPTNIFTLNNNNINNDDDNNNNDDDDDNTTTTTNINNNDDDDATTITTTTNDDDDST